MKQIDILNLIVDEFREKKSISGIMLMGSVADGTATEISDLDLMFLCDSDKFEANFIDNILVEYIFTKYDTALYKLQNKDMEVYRYINSKILYDNGKLQELMTIANERYKNFKTNTQTKKEIYHWLVGLNVKLMSSLKRNDVLKTNFLTATNSWKLTEAIWAVNDKPMPPSGSVIKFLNELTITPFDHWFEKLFNSSDSEKTMTMMAIIDWVLPKLKETHSA
jgi:predicted nucleotidyltransferase